MKKYIKKSLSLLLSTFLFFGNFIFASAEKTTDSAENNFDFAVKTAEIIKDNESSMLRIIGKITPDAKKFDFSYASESVFSQDGRFVLQFSTENELLACLEMLQNRPDVIYAERDVPVYTGALEKAAASLSWGVDAIEADIYSQSISPAEGDSVTVAIVDSGSEDIDFIKNKLVDGYDFYDNDSDAFQDESSDSHGTFLASIVADCTGNLPVKIMPVRVLDSKNASLINVINGIRYAADNGADIINLSLCAILNNCKSLEDALAYAESKGATVVVCAGNAKSDVKNYCPSHCESAITVSSSNSTDGFSYSFSNYGDAIDLAAPGEFITGYNAMGEITYLSGTSMSAAFVSAAAALFLLDNPACNTNQVKSALESSAKDLGTAGKDIYFGAGIPKLGSLANSDKKYVESIRFSQDSYSLYLSEKLAIEPVFSPSDATDKSFTLSSDSGCISINGNVITAVSQGTAILTVTSNDGLYTDTAEITVTANRTELKIKNNTGSKTINYGETLRLTAEIINEAPNTNIWWYVDGIKNGEGKTFEVSPESGSIEVTAKLVDTNSAVIKDKNGDEISDSQTVSVKSGFLQKIISFFKNLFGMNRTVIQFLKKI